MMRSRFFKNLRAAFIPFQYLTCVPTTPSLELLRQQLLLLVDFFHCVQKQGDETHQTSFCVDKASKQTLSVAL